MESNRQVLRKTQIRSEVVAQSGVDRGQALVAAANIPETGFVRIRQILAVFPIGRSTWWACVKSGRFPRPVKLGARTTAWRVEEIRSLLTLPRVQLRSRTTSANS